MENRLSFIPIDYLFLIKGNKYMIETNGPYCTKIYYIGYYLFHITNKIYFNCETKTRSYIPIWYDLECKIYEPNYKKEKIQQQMEQRALILILQKITGDELFNY